MDLKKNNYPSKALRDAMSINDWAAFCKAVTTNDDGSQNELILYPDWTEANKRLIHDFRTHVPELLQQKWDSLELSAKVSIFIMAQELADQEEWD